MTTANTSDQAPPEEMLSPFRVLDLTEGGCLYCGKLLGDMGADVIKIEEPGGSPSRSIGPFWHDRVHPEKSIFWWAYNANKRSVTFDIESTNGSAAFLRLVEGADFVLDSFSPGYMGSIGLGYQELSRINPRIIVCSITPFGQSGPKAHNAWSDLSVWASSGLAYLTGHPTRPPVGISFMHQAALHGGTEAAVACLIALYDRGRSGQGQYIDVSMQESSYSAMTSWQEYWETSGIIPRRKSTFAGVGRVFDPDINEITREARQLYPAKDGILMYDIQGGARNRLQSSRPVVEWMREEGMAPDWLLKLDWSKGFELNELSQETVQAVEECFVRFFQGKTKLEVMKRSVDDHFMVGPIHTIKDIATHPQLRSRGFFREVWHQELESNVTYCGPYVEASETPMSIRRRAPLIGEHNQEILGQELGIGEKDLRALEAVKVASTKPRPAKATGEPVTSQGPRPLEGLKVVIAGHVVVGPLSGWILGLHGATVVRVDSHSRVDSLRVQRPFFPGQPRTINNGPYFANVNSSMLCVGVDWKLPTGKRIVDKLLRWADVVLENFSVGTMERLGFGYSTVSIDNPGVVYISTCMFGQKGPMSELVGLGSAGMAMAGFVHLTGWPDLDPNPLQTYYTDYINYKQAAAAILGALEYRRRTGRGQYLDQSQVEGGIQYLSPMVMDWFSNGRSADRSGNRLPEAAPHGIYSCLGDDRWCFIGVFDDSQWHGLQRAMDNPPWAAAEKFETAAGRKQYEDELDVLVPTWTITRAAEDVEAQLQAEGVPSSVVENSQDTRLDVQLNHRGFFRRIEHSVIGEHTYRGPCFRFSRTPDSQFAGPALGEHNTEVCKMLGMTDGEIEETVREGGLGTEPVSL
ncbi:MAG: hypothetical protein BZY82_00230 [SAR202 cluster bacterium Io17-Chloro-G3]|nr:MAG: hypothetical protein BZY82_00230 [SAR202 cluster bacterium Io17-Chloro-G3]